MKLPIIEHRLHNLVVPSSKQEIKFRAFRVKEHKLLLEALEMQDGQSLINTIGDIVESCTVPKLDVSLLSMYDMDYIFLHIRAKSLGEIVPVEYTCINPTNKLVKQSDDYIGEPVYEYGPCNSKVIVNLDLNAIEVYYPQDYDKRRVVMISEDIGIKLKCPSFYQFRELDKVENVKSLFSVTERFIYACVESIFEGDKVSIPDVDFNFSEMEEFLESLPTNVIDEINLFFDEMPYTALKIPLECPYCKHKGIIEIKELEDFFV